MTIVQAKDIIARANIKAANKPTNAQILEAMRLVASYGLRAPVLSQEQMQARLDAIQASNLSQEIRDQVAAAHSSEVLTRESVAAADATEAVDTVLEQQSFWSSVKSFFRF
jgi:hypothetical protein